MSDPKDKGTGLILKGGADKLIELLAPAERTEPTLQVKSLKFYISEREAGSHHSVQDLTGQGDRQGEPNTKKKTGKGNFHDEDI